MSKKRSYFMKEVSVEKVQRVAQQPGIEVLYSFTVNPRPFDINKTMVTKSSLQVYLVTDEFIYTTGYHKYYDAKDHLVKEPIGVRFDKTDSRYNRIRGRTKTLSELLHGPVSCTVSSKAKLNLSWGETQIDVVLTEPEVVWNA